MYLKSITMKGFKSFAERTRLEFGPGTSVIVGPNGSGKSNVTDAVLWALGEQSPIAVRGHSMQDVIFGGAPGRQAASSATVELVLDDSEGTLGLGPEVSIMRRLDRSGDGEYRIGGARCRLVDVLEILSDTGLGKEMHSVVSQGRIEAIVTSKPRDRRLLIEEAAGLGKHRKRRRRAQIKLGHTQDNLDRALDVEREARSRLKPLKRQAEAAELHERVHRQILEARWELAREELRSRRLELSAAIEQVAAARDQRQGIDEELAQVAVRRRLAEEALAARSTRREELARQSFAAQSAADRVGYRADAVGQASMTVSSRMAAAQARLAELGESAAVDAPDPQAQERIAALRQELAALAHDREAELERQLAELERQRTRAAELELERAERVEQAKRERERAELACEQARLAVREAERAVDLTRRESARVGGELAAVNQFLRAHQGAPDGARSLADSLTVASGFELAVAAALDGRLGAALLDDRDAADALLDRAGRDGGRVLMLKVAGQRPDGASSSAPTPDAVALADHIAGGDAAHQIARRLLANAWVVDDLRAVGDDFGGIAVTRSGRVFVGATGELRQAPRVGDERVLAERNRREQLVADSEAAVRQEQQARAGLEQAAARAAELDAERELAVATYRSAVSGLDEAAEEQRRLAAAVERRRAAPDEGPGADRRAQLEAQLSVEEGRLERAERALQERDAMVARLQAELSRDQALLPQIRSIEDGLRGLGEAIAARRAQFDAELQEDREAGEHVASELRSCAQEEAVIQSRLHAAAEALTAAEVRAQRARDQEADSEQSLMALALELELEPVPATEAMDERQRDELRIRLERLHRRREQIGPVNPLAQGEYADAVAHVEELETQRADLESALRELEGLIRDTDRQIRETFEQTFESAADHFEQLVARVFPGGTGRLRLVSEGEGQAAVIGGAKLDDGESVTDPEDRPGDDAPDEDLLGVEIEITPAGKSMKRLTLLSGGEKSMTALAFLFAVFLARPCPFYVMDEVEAALDDLNISRFLDLLDTYNDRAQFIVVTHQKRTMEAADSLYGVAMGGDGVSKVVSRQLPSRVAA